MLRFFQIAAAVVIAALQLQSSTPALAKEKWVYISSDRSFQYYVDVNSLKRKGNFAWFWSGAAVIIPPDVKPDDRFYRVRFIALYESVDCRSGATRLRSLRSYDKNQNLIPELSDDAKNGGLLGSGDRKHPVMRYVCRR
ncbi:MAG: hypothetical protein KME45_15635 [Stenomitos rutilans HA7619-LM2]|jgi:hypothetical protein|nr:hypothetical protein [Stenomitos rutilans HA7619-LM2]